MKRFAVILIVAVLAIGCVFAATGDSQNKSGTEANSGHNFYVETTINAIYPVYQITGTNKNGKVTSKADDVSNKITGELSSDGKAISVNVALEQFGMTDNDLSAATKAAIRYFGDVTVTIKAGKLTLVKETGKTYSGHTEASDVPTLKDFAAVTELNNVTIADGTADATATSDYTADALKLTYNGKVVTGSDAVQTVAEGGFTWNIEELTAGDTYRADVVVTYTAE